MSQRLIGRGGFFALGFGTIVGSLWLVVLGDWLMAAGPAGALIGLASGAAIMVMVALSYAELAARLPMAGGEFTYALYGFGPRVAFAVGWFLTLYAISVSAFEGIVLGTFITKLMPFISGPVLYTVLSSPTGLGAVSVGLLTGALLCMVNVRGIRASITLQTLATAGFLVLVGGIVAMGLVKGHWQNLRPWFAAEPHSSWWAGASWIFATSALFLNGFQVALYAVEDRAPSLSVRNVVVVMVWSVIAAAAFYGLVVVSAGSMQPWTQLVTLQLPTIAAYASLAPAGVIEVAILVAACMSLLKTWNALLVLGSRLVTAQAAAGLLPAALAAYSAGRAAPVRAIVLVSCFTLALIPFGRGAVLPIVNMVSICLAFTYIASLLVLLRLRGARVRSIESEASFRVPGGRVTIWIALLGSLGMELAALIQPALTTPGIPLEWILIIAWAIAGALIWRARRHWRTCIAVPMSQKES